MGEVAGVSSESLHQMAAKTRNVKPTGGNYKRLKLQTTPSAELGFAL
jgi:hypothetical protein